MAIHNTPQERTILKLLAKLPISDEERQAWIQQIQGSGMTEELAAQVHDRLTAAGSEDHPVANRAMLVVELSQAIRQWRMAQGAKKFH